MIAGAGRDRAARALAVGQPRHPVVGATDLEAEDRLQIFALQPPAVADSLRQPRRRIERCLPRDLVDAAGQDLPQQLIHHLRSSGACRRTSSWFDKLTTSERGVLLYWCG